MATLFRARTSAGVAKTVLCSSTGALELSGSMSLAGLPDIGPQSGAAALCVVAASDGFAVDASIADAGPLALDTSLAAIAAQLPAALGPATAANSLSCSAAFQAAHFANGVEVAVGTATSAVAYSGYKLVTLCGNSSAAATLTLEVSRDGSEWWPSSHVIVLGAGDVFEYTTPLAAHSIRLKTSATSTIVAVAMMAA